MPKLKVDDNDLDINELEDAEFTEFEQYDGEIPPNGTQLSALIKRMWWTYTQTDDTPMLVTLVVAQDNEGELEEYNGLVIYDRAKLAANTKFRWFPLLSAIGLTIRDVKTKAYVEDDDDPRFGAPITKIGDWEPESDAAWVTIITGRERDQEGNWRPKVAKWLEFQEPAEAEPDEPEPARPTSKARPGSRASSSATPAAGRSRRAAVSEPEPDDEDKPAPRGRRQAGTNTATAAAKPAAGRGRTARKGSGSTEDPPF